MGKNTSNKGKIEYIDRFKSGKYVQGHFSKGDFIATTVMFVVHVMGQAAFEVGRDVLLKHDPKRTRITDKFLDSFKGKDSSILK